MVWALVRIVSLLPQGRQISTQQKALGGDHSLLPHYDDDRTLVRFIASFSAIYALIPS